MGQKQKRQQQQTHHKKQTHMHLSLKTVKEMAKEKLSALFVHTNSRFPTSLIKSVFISTPEISPHPSSLKYPILEF